MKFTPEVVAALKVLRDNAESDFERHRIDVLERDLHEPPTVEVIDDTHQRFNGVNYHQDKTGHFKGSTILAREVWAYFYGEPPKGDEIHHIDSNPANNNVNNFQCLSRSEHRRLHRLQSGKIQGRIATYTCEQCGKIFETRKGRVKFCSAKCQHKAAYQLEKENPEEHICVGCGNKFWVRRGKKQKYCSKSCALKHRNRKD